MKFFNHTRLAGRGFLIIILVLASLAPLMALPDLDVAYISRTPRYDRYSTYDINGLDPYDWGNPLIVPTTPDELNKQRWPAPGDTVTFTAVIKNAGDSATGKFNYKWYFDGAEVASGVLSSLRPGDQVSTSYKWTWDSEWNDHYIKFVADPDNLITESLKNNNSREDRTNALTFCIPVWQSVYDWFHDNIRSYNPNLGSFDDWIQMQLGYINQLFIDAAWPNAPSGILERVRLDMVQVVPEDTVDPGYNHRPNGDPYLNWDAAWGFAPGEYPGIFTKEGRTDFLTGPFTWLIHEWGHQMCLADMYQLNLSPDVNEAMPSLGHETFRGSDLMSGNEQILTDETANAFNSDLHKRRGYYGDYLYDMPNTCRIRLIDAYGRPVPNATLTFYQKHGGAILNNVEFTLTTDAEGCCNLPNRSCYAPDGSYTTLTGHTLHDNPWGMISVVNTNGLFLCKIEAAGQIDWQFVEATSFNVGYSMGYTDSYTYPVQTTILPEGRDKVTTSDLYGIKMLSSDCGYIAGSNGAILKYDGAKWSVMTSPVTSSLRAVDALSPTGKACAVGDGGTVLIYSDGNWTKKDVGTTTTFTSCVMLSESNIIIGGNTGIIYKSTDGGSTWTNVTGTGITSIRSMSFSDAIHGVLTCNNGRIYYTTDGGSTWKIASGSYNWANITGCSMPTTTEAWACNNDGDIFRSLDGGAHWSTIFNWGPSDDWNAIDVRPGGLGWAVGGPHDYNHYANIKRLDGKRWYPETARVHTFSDTMNDVSCISDTEGWAVGNAGVILHINRNYLKPIEDSTPPIMGEVIDEGPTTYNSTTIKASWSATDAESGVAEYQYAIGISPTDTGSGYILDWKRVGKCTSIEAGIKTTPGQTYYIYAKARNYANLWSDAAASKGVTVFEDTTPPVMGAVTASKGSQSGVQFNLHWSAADPESGIMEYQYAVGTSPTDPGSGYIRGWTSAGKQTSIDVTGLNLASGNTFYFYVKARNYAGLWSDVAVSNEAKTLSIGEAKLLPDYSIVQLWGVISAGNVSPYELYVESPDRSAGIAVQCYDLYLPGTILSVEGIITSYNGEACIAQPAIKTYGSMPLRPLELNNSSIGGDKMGLQDAHWGWRWIKNSSGVREYKWLPAKGLNNVGLLVKTTGKVSYIDPTGKFAYISDSSLTDDGNKLGIGSTAIKGIRVSLWNNFQTYYKIPPVGTRVTVTGISGTDWVNSCQVSALRLRSQNDITGIEGAIISGRVASLVTTNQLVECSHPYQPNCDQTWEITGPSNTDRMRLHFPFIQILDWADGLYYGQPGNLEYSIYNYEGEMWSNWVAGNKIDLRLITSSTDNYYGFQMDSYEAFIPMSGVTITLTPGNYTTTTDEIGNFIVMNLQPGTYMVTPSKSGCTFTPSNQIVTVTTNQFKVVDDFTCQ